MTAEQMKTLRKLVLNSCDVHLSLTKNTYSVKLVDENLYDLIEWVDNYKKEVK
jgi:hypothetical protein